MVITKFIIGAREVEVDAVAKAGKVRPAQLAVGCRWLVSGI